MSGRDPVAGRCMRLFASAAAGWRRRLTRLLPFLMLLLAVAVPRPAEGQEPASLIQHRVQPGDTWLALGLRYGTDPAALHAEKGTLNRQRQPTIGSTLAVPAADAEQTGTLLRPFAGGTVGLAASHGHNPWSLALSNRLNHPFTPLLHAPLLIPGGTEPPRELPQGFETLELSRIPAQPGQALSVRGLQYAERAPAAVRLDGWPFNSFGSGEHFVALGGTNAFYWGGEPELQIVPAQGPAWSQPWWFERAQWITESVNYTGAAAAIDREMIMAERERLMAIWTTATPVPQWDTPFTMPITDYVANTSQYGTRRSVNGAPPAGYHEGLDYSAYRGTRVNAPAAGTVVVAEVLDVRGGAVILDHGLGLYTGYYHLSEINVEPGQSVAPGDLLGGVGTSGLSTGNHLHWDMLVGGTWVDAGAWLEQDLGCWVLEGYGGELCAVVDDPDSE